MTVLTPARFSQGSPGTPLLRMWPREAPARGFQAHQSLWADGPRGPGRPGGTRRPYPALGETASLASLCPAHAVGCQVRICRNQARGRGTLDPPPLIGSFCERCPITTQFNAYLLQNLLGHPAALDLCEVTSCPPCTPSLQDSRPRQRKEQAGLHMIAPLWLRGIGVVMLRRQVAERSDNVVDHGPLAGLFLEAHGGHSQRLVQAPHGVLPQQQGIGHGRELAPVLEQGTCLDTTQHTSHRGSMRTGQSGHLSYAEKEAALLLHWLSTIMERWHRMVHTSQATCRLPGPCCPSITQIHPQQQPAASKGPREKRARRREELQGHPRGPGPRDGQHSPMLRGCAPPRASCCRWPSSP